MALFDELATATYNGVSFFWQSFSTEGGPKSVTHEYPNSTRRFVEFLGVNQKSFTVVAVIADDPASGTTYLQNRTALIRELERPQLGTLILPIGGSFSVGVKNFSESTAKTEFGRATFTITFEATDNSQTQPQPEFGNQGEILGFSLATLKNLADNVAARFNVSLNFPDNFDDAEQIVNDVIKDFENNTVGLTTVTRAANGFNKLIATATRDVIKLINTPADLAQTVDDLFSSMSLSVSSAIDRVALAAKFYTFGDDFTPINVTTQSREERKRNRDVLVLQMQAGSLAQAYNDTALIEFDNVEELDDTANQLDTQFEKVIELPELTEEIRNNLTDLKAKTRVLLDVERVTAPKVETVETFRVPITVLTYRYYGNIDDAQALIDLNAFRDVSRIEGDVDILTP